MNMINLPEDIADVILANSTLALEPMPKEPTYRVPEMRLDYVVPMLEKGARSGTEL
jgi:hypothetical protein